MKTQEELRKINECGIMPRVKGKYFRCDCGANVFHHPTFPNLMPDGRGPSIISEKHYKCNGCGTIYIGE